MNETDAINKALRNEALSDFPEMDIGTQTCYCYGQLLAIVSMACSDDPNKAEYAHRTTRNLIEKGRTL
jgi:hypothetical protein